MTEHPPKTAEQLLLNGIAEYVHDIRNPLVSVRGYAKMVLEGRAGPLQDTQKEYLAIVAENLNRMVLLLNELAEVVTSEPLRLEPLDLRDLWRDSLQSCKAKALAKGIHIGEKAPVEALVLYGDRAKLRQVLSDLLRGAVHAAAPGDEIAAELSRTAEDQALARIWQPLEESADRGADSVASRFQQLSGLVSQQQALVRSHGGRLSLARQGAGAALLLLLPA